MAQRKEISIKQVGLQSQGRGDMMPLLQWPLRTIYLPSGAIYVAPERPAAGRFDFSFERTFHVLSKGVNHPIPSDPVQARLSITDSWIADEVPQAAKNLSACTKQLKSTNSPASRT